MFVTRLARSYGVLRPEIMRYLSDGNACRTVKVRSLKQMDVVMELDDGTFMWFDPDVDENVGGEDDEDEEQQ